MKRAYEFRIYPSEEQKILLGKHFGSVRWVYNYALNKKIEHYKKTGKTLSRYNIQAELPILKRLSETEWLKETNASSLQATLIHLDIAYNRFFSKTANFPKFKNKKSKQSFEIPKDLFVNFDNSSIDIPKFKEPIKTVFHRKFSGEIRTCHIKKTKANNYYVSILVEDGISLPKKVEIKKDTSVGIDVGIKSFLITSDGEEIKNPRHLIKSEHKLKKIQRAFSRKIRQKKKGEELSNNAKKQKLELQKLHEHVANQRKDFLHKVSTKLISENQTICIEDLNIVGMLKNRKLSKSISDVGWGKFFEFLKYKSEWYGKNILTIGRFEPSSKIINCHGYYNKDLKLSDRTVTCPVCGKSYDRDINAAINIRDFSFVNTGSNRNTQESKPVIDGTALATSAGRSLVMTIKSHEDSSS